MQKHENYVAVNQRQRISESDPFTEERYVQFARYIRPANARVLDVGCNTGRGGMALKRVLPDCRLCGLDIVAERLEQLPSVYTERLLGGSTKIPGDDRTFDAIVAGEFIEHLYPHDVDATLCEFQRLLRIGGLLLMTTPNPGYLKNKVMHLSVYCESHLTQHHPKSLKERLLMHGFARVRLRGSGKVTRYLGPYMPWMALYGSYLIHAMKI